jgi:dihydroorotase
MSLVHDEKIDVKTLIARLTVGPAKILNKPLGTLKTGSTADVTVFDPNRQWLVDTSKFVSKGKNTPLAGRTLKGKVMATIYGGRVVYRVKVTGASPSPTSRM